MQLEQDELVEEGEKVKKEIAYWREVLQKAEKYERLMEDQDFKDVLLEVAETVKFHDREIQEALEGFSAMTLPQLDEAKHIIFIHQMKREYAQSAVSRPKEIVELAKAARKNIPELEERLKSIKEVLHAT